jgi:hypothetical protein
MEPVLAALCLAGLVVPLALGLVTGRRRRTVDRWSIRR